MLRPRARLGSPALFAIIYTLLASAIYFSLGVVADHALGADAGRLPGRRRCSSLLAAMTYVEGASLHQERAGATVFARYAFNELWSFVAGWAMLLDYVILIAVTTFSATNYLAAFWEPLGARRRRVRRSRSAIIVYVAVAQRPRLLARARASASALLVLADFVLQIVLIVARAGRCSSTWHKLTDPVDLGTTPTWRDLVFALGAGDGRLHRPGVGVGAGGRGGDRRAAGCGG